MKRDEFVRKLHGICLNLGWEIDSKDLCGNCTSLLAEFDRLSKIEEAARLCREAVSDKSLSDGAFRFTVASLLSGQNPPTLTDEEKRNLQAALGKED